MSELDIDQQSLHTIHDNNCDIKQEEFDGVSSDKFTDDATIDMSLQTGQQLQSPFVVQSDQRQYNKQHGDNLSSASVQQNNYTYVKSEDFQQCDMLPASSSQICTGNLNFNKGSHFINVHENINATEIKLNGTNLSSALIESLSKCATSVDQRNLLMRMIPSLYSSDNTECSADQLTNIHKAIHMSTNALHSDSTLRSQVDGLDSQRTVQLLSQLGVIGQHQQHHIHHHNHPNDHDCEYCGRNYSNIRKLKRHLSSSHKKEKKYACDDCGKKFGYKHILQEHKNLHYGIKPYACSLCNKRFAAKSNLIQHRHRHVASQQQQMQSNEYQFISDDKNVLLNSSNPNRSGHTSPTGIFTEDDANKSFHSIDVLSESQISPLPVNAYIHSCSQCDNRFTSERALRAHEMSAHGRQIRNSNIMSFRCVICGQTFFNGNLYADHCRTVHPDSNVNPKSNHDQSQQHKLPFHANKDTLLNAIMLAATANDDQWSKSNTIINDITLNAEIPCQNINNTSLCHLQAITSASNSRSQAITETVNDSRLNSCHTESDDLTSTNVAESTNADKVVTDMGIQVDCCSNPLDHDSLSMDDLLSRYVAQGRLFKCKHCDTYFKERGIYSMHAVLHGDECPWQCSVCGRKMNDRNEFTLHFVNQQHHSA